MLSLRIKANVEPDDTFPAADLLRRWAFLRISPTAGPCDFHPQQTVDLRPVSVVQATSGHGRFRTVWFWTRVPA